MFEYLTGQ